MRILKIKGKDEETVMSQIKKEYGENIIVISKHQEKQKGMFGFLKKSTYIVTIAVEEQENFYATTVDKTTEEVEQDSYSLLLNLKDQVDHIKKDIDEVKSATKRVVTPTPQPVLVPVPMAKEQLEEVATLKSMVKNALKEVGVHEEVLKGLLVNITIEDEIEDLVRKLYENISSLMLEETEENLPQTIFFIGSTGVGKTTTIAKLTAEYALNQKKRLALFTADTYRIAAIEQLRTYADIVGVPIEIIYSEEELLEYIDKWKEMDHLFVDTAGRSHKNKEQIQEMKALLKKIPEKKVFLVLNMNTAYKDIKNIIDTYREITADFQIIITKLDETDDMGNLLNIAYYAKTPITYVTHGQNVPDDISHFRVDTYIKELLGRINYE